MTHKKKKKERKRIETSKLLMIFLFLNCTIIEIFTMWAEIKSLQIAQLNFTSPDFTPLTTLIGAVVGEVISFGVYAIKSAKENTQGGVTYLKAMHELQNPAQEESAPPVIEDDENCVG